MSDVLRHLEELEVINHDIGAELDKQLFQLDHLNERVSHATEKAEQQNVRVKKIISDVNS
jgi:hypothetical protein